MAEFIDRQALLRYLNDIWLTATPNDSMPDDDRHLAMVRCMGLNDAMDAVKSLPAADVRPVVTCGKCKYGKYTGTEWFCDKHSGHADKFGEDASYHEYHSKYWFCADGEERKHE